MTFNDRPYQILVHFKDERTGKEKRGYFSTPVTEHCDLEPVEYLRLVQAKFPEGKFSIQYYDEFSISAADEARAESRFRNTGRMEQF